MSYQTSSLFPAGTSLQKDVLGLVDASGKTAGAPGVRVDALHQGAMGLADRLLARARAKASGSLASASPFTEKVEKGGSTLFRARFAGFDDSKDAQNACNKLKRGGFSCFATRS